MATEDLYKSLHARNEIMHEAIKDVVHDAACRCHTSTLPERVEAQLRHVAQEVTEAAERDRDAAS